MSSPAIWPLPALARPAPGFTRAHSRGKRAVKTLAIAEKWAGDGMAAQNFVTLSVGRGIGLGIVINRTLYRGAAGGAGELGHVTIDPDGPACECGRAGCLEAFVGEPALLRAATERLGAPVDRDRLLELIKADDPTVADILCTAGISR